MRLIDADALLEKMKISLPMEDDISECVSNCARTARRLVAKAPTVDPVKHGEWKVAGTCDKGDKTYIVNQCSNCGAIKLAITDYCPDCGAKMDGGT